MANKGGALDMRDTPSYKLNLYSAYKQNLKNVLK